MHWPPPSGSSTRRFAGGDLRVDPSHPFVALSHWVQLQGGGGWPGDAGWGYIGGAKAVRESAE